APDGLVVTGCRFAIREARTKPLWQLAVPSGRGRTQRGGAGAPRVSVGHAWASRAGLFRIPANCVGPYTARRLRPLARRALMTARPPRVFIRTKKPWVRLRRVTEGWKVRFIGNPNIKELAWHAQNRAYQY